MNTKEGGAGFKLQLNKETIRRLRKRDLEEVMGGTICLGSCVGACGPKHPDPGPIVTVVEGGTL